MHEKQVYPRALSTHWWSFNLFKGFFGAAKIVGESTVGVDACLLEAKAKYL